MDSPSSRPVGSADPGALVAQWHNGLRIPHIAHSRSAATCELRGRVLGVAVIVLTTIVGTAIFATLESSPSSTVRIVAGLASVGAAVLAALQTFLDFERRAARHREIATAYGALRRELEAGTAFPETGADLTQLLGDIRQRWDALDAIAPATSARIHRAAARDVRGPFAGEDGRAPRRS